MEHPVPSGPLAVRWLRYSVGEVHAGSLTAARVELENAGLATWRAGVCASYHWLDERGNPLFWDGLRTPAELAHGDRAELELPLRGPIPPGAYRLAFDLVDEGRLWFAEVGNHAPELEVEVLPRSPAGAVDWLPADVEPAPDRAGRVRAAHEEGYAAVGGSLEVVKGRLGRVPEELRPFAPGGGRSPGFAHPLVCPSLLPGLQPNEEVAGLPAWRPEGDEPWLYDGRITARLRAGRRGG
jgi:hypothetical protein